LLHRRARRRRGRRSDVDLLQLGLRELAALVPCGLVASAIPSSSRWGSVLYGVAIPALVAAIVVVARARG